MSKKIKPGNGGYVYSTDPNFKLNDDEDQTTVTLPPSEQKLKIVLDKKQRAGKAVTLIQGFTGNMTDLETLGKQLRNFCGTGGSAKGNEIIIQGDQRSKVLQWLQKNGYKQTKQL